MKLDLACGMVKEEGFIGVDRLDLPGVDRIVDLEQYPWPWADEVIEEIRCRYYLEETENVEKFIDECYRILVPGGKLIVICPYHASSGAWGRPFIKRLLPETFFTYFNAEARKQLNAPHYDIKADFDFQLGYLFTPQWQNRNEEARMFALGHYMNVASELHVNMTKKPGAVQALAQDL